MAHVRLELRLSPDAGFVPLFPQALEQILVNLIINALDAMADVPQPKLSITTERRAGHCLIEVTDNGHGIRPEHMRRLFEPFFTTKSVGKGTGLGLSISYSLVRKLGGEITVRSEAGQGSTFVVRLPAAPEGDDGGSASGGNDPGNAKPASQNWEASDPPFAVSGNDDA
jgi:C4-dicarboxylate-specific signal transduction histidine kinase